MKKAVWAVLIFLVLIGGVWYIKRGKKIVPDEAIAKYSNSNVDVSFSYPKILTASTTDTTVTLHHEVPFAHADSCDFKGDDASSTASTIPTLTDFNATFHVDDTNLIAAMQTENPEIPAETFVNGAVIPSPGFIEPIAFGNLHGYMLSESAEGCGQTTYFLSASKTKTLVVQDELIGVFGGATDPTVQSQALATPGIITPQSAMQILTSVLNTVKVQ